MTPSDPLLTVANLATGYGDLRVVWDVSLEVWPGRITAILGRNGAGKTTTLRAIAGLNDIHGGSIQFEGEDLGKVSTHKRVIRGISYVQEGKRVFRQQTVEENLLLGGYTRGMSRSKLGAEIAHMYELFPILREKRKEAAGALSGGQQQMVAIGQALMTRPKLLMLDEPSGGLAPSIVSEVMSRVGELKESGIGILLVEQALEAALKVADHVVVLDIGKVVKSASIDAIGDLQEIKDAYLSK